MFASTKGRYALRVLADLAEHGTDQNEYIPLKDIARRQEISEKYLEAIVKMLVKEKLLIGVRGKGGGYRLARKPEEYPIGEILRVTEGGIHVVSCLAEDADTCPRSASCRTLSMWTRLDELIGNYLDSITIADLIADTGKKGS